MLWFLILNAMFAGPALGAISYDDGNCAQRPTGGPASCVAILSCAATVCNATEVNELKTVFTNFRLGDTIKLQAGRVWELNAFSVGSKAGSGYLLVTSTVDLSQLSTGALVPGARITQHYRGRFAGDYANALVPTISNAAGYANALTLLGSSASPASHIKFRWVRFAARYTAAGLVQAGSNPPTTFPLPDTWFPYEIHFEQCIFEPEGWPQYRVGSLLGGRVRGQYCPGYSIVDSYFQGGRVPTSQSVETQLIALQFGCAEITNNYLGDNAGENLFFGGTGNGGTDSAGTGEVGYNAIVNHKFRVMYQPWAPNTRYGLGVIIRQAGQNYYCTQSHVSGAAFDPSKWSAVNFYWPYKNSFECKNCRSLKIHHNLVDGGWFGDGQQNQMGPVLKLSNCIGWTSSCQCPPQYSFRCDRNGTVVTRVSGSVPRIYNSQSGFATYKTLNINGVAYDIADFDPRNPDRLVLASGSGSQANATCTFGTTNCFMSYIQDISVEHNVFRNGPIGLVLVQAAQAEYQRNTFNIRVRHNLSYDMDWQYWRAANQQHTAADYEGHLNAAGFPFTIIENNTWVNVRNATYGISNIGGTTACFGIPEGTGPCQNGWTGTSSEMVFRNNILSRGSTPTFVRGSAPANNNTAQVILQRMCGSNQICDQGEWEGNVFAGADLAQLPAKNYNLCPNASACQVNWLFDDPARGSLFENHAAGIFRVRPNWQGFSGPIGADWDRLPIVTRPSDGRMGVDITTSPGTATLTWRMTAPQRHLTCTIEVSNHASGWDFDNLIAPLPPLSTSTGPLERQIILSGLSSGKHYFRLHCGGALVEPSHYSPYGAEGEFTIP